MNVKTTFLEEPQKSIFYEKTSLKKKQSIRLHRKLCYWSNF